MVAVTWGLCHPETSDALEHAHDAGRQHSVCRAFGDGNIVFRPTREQGLIDRTGIVEINE